MKKMSIVLAVTLIISMVLAPLASAQPVLRAGNDSVPAETDGWVWVGTAEELAYINRNQASYLDRNIRLTGDIDMTGYDWVPIADEATVFSGIFDGRGHRIEGLTIDGGALQYVGFFGRVSGTIRNLGLSAQVNGGSYAGGLVGHLIGGSIINSYSEGTVTGGNTGYGGLSAAGGLAGAANGDSTILRSSSSAAVKSGDASNQFAGGLVASQGTGSINDSYATGTVAYTGGDHYFYGGGLAGHLIYGTIANSYSSTAIMQSGSISYSTIGGFIGIISNASINSSYFDKVASTQASGVGFVGNLGQPHLTGLTTDEMKAASNYGGWDFANTWAVHTGVNGGYPYLRPDILTTDLPRAAKDAPYSIAIDAFDGARGGLSWSASGLPNGLSMTASGRIEGSAAVSGAFPVTVSVTDAGQNTVSAVLTLYVDEPAPDIDGLAISPGRANGSTSVTAVPGDSGHTFAYWLGPDAGVRPLVGDALPGEAVLYSLGADIVDPIPGQYLQVFELDVQQRIQAWSSVQVEAAHIRDQVRVTGVTLDQTELTLTAGGASQKLKAVLVPVNASNPTVSWNSSDPAVAQVDQRGEVTPIAEGTAAVTVTTADGGFTATAAVTVQSAPVDTGTVIGAVYGTGNTPLVGAAVSVGGIKDMADAEGRFTVNNVAAGSHALTVTAAAYNDYTTTVNVLAGGTVDVGRIDLRAAYTAEPVPPSYSWVPVSAPSPVPDPRMVVTINGKQVRVTAKKEQEHDGRTVLRLIPDSDLVRSWTAGGEDIVIDIDNEDPVVKVDLPAEALQVLLSAKPSAAIRIGVNGASYSVPLHVLSDLKNRANVTVVIAKMADSARRQLDEVLTRQGHDMLAEPMSFELYSNGDVRIEGEDTYLKRTFLINDAAGSDRSTVVWVDGAGKPRFVPSIFEGETATFYSPYNGVYTAVRSNRTFEDIQGHWAQSNIERMANKLIVNGSADGMFDPNRTVTRAEFVAMLVRALGLTEKPQLSSYSDVGPNEIWYAGAIGAASAAGLIEGYADGSFRPDARITREQVAVMLARAARYAGELPPKDASTLESFSDHAQVSDWAKGATADLLAAGMIEGVEKAAFAPQALATRAQSTVLLNRMLLYLNFMN
ncbi:S-layer homology domain-containing protein [Paenibacillus sp. p3-SID867]|uniref:S-layer homology domain-containing protein n=1 Tax=Paenibacillus sp. p3-SID867 TaxID=2916363 RepID=UPI0021A2853C|nr:S-layer homology domain-containing protein [Paenibacillus sp. p3-SID867]MCT1398443.1 S-layer homology domain-containing protein [Paenibacillus sp. p3-SID867]